MKPGRNDPCPCGSGRKYKHCCGMPQATAAPAPAAGSSPMLAASGVDPQQISALVALVNRDQLVDAEQRCRSLLTAHPESGLVWKVLSVALVRQGKEALPALQRAALLLPGDAESHRNLATALLERRQLEPALQSLQYALTLEPDQVATLVEMGDTLRALRRPAEAIALYQRALQREPRAAEAHNNLGNAYQELGQHAEAIDRYRQALALRPREAQILCNLGLSLAELTRREEAVTHYRQALEIEPGFVEALDRLGNVLRDLGERAEAAAVFRRAVELDPQLADSHYNFGNALFELRRIGQAEASYRRALSLQPDHAGALLSLGIAQRQLRQPAEAEANCRAALALEPDNVDALAFLGELQADRGQFAAAEELFQRAIALKSDFAYAYASIATHRRMTSVDSAWLQGVTSLLARNPPLRETVSLNYALGKYYDDTRQYPAAFARYRKANENAKRLAAPYDSARLSQRVDRIVQRFDAPFLQRVRAAGSPSALPVFIIGMPRSGTSLAEQILASHPAAYGAGELSYWHGAFAAFERAQDADSGGAGNAAVELLPGLASDYLAQLAELAGGAQRVVDKMPANFLYAGLIQAALPQARIIHMQRDPLDTCLSIYFQNFFNIGPYAHDLEHLAQYYREYLRIMEHWRTLLPASALLEVPYEALVDDTEAWSRRMIEFIGLPWDPACLEFHRTERVVLTASKWQVRQKISRGSIGRWRNYEAYVGPLRTLMA